MMRWISPDKLASTTLKVSTDFLKQNGLEVVNEWHHSPHGVDLFIWTGGPGEMIKFQLSVLGLILEWNRGSGLRTGMVIEEESSNPLNKMSATDLIKYDSQPQKSTVEYCGQILSELKDLESAKKRSMLDILGVRRSESALVDFFKAWFKKK